MKKKDINFLNAYRLYNKYARRSDNRRTLSRLLATTLISIIIILAGSGAVYGYDLYCRRILGNETVEVDNLRYFSDYDEIIEKSSEYKLLSKYSSTVTEVKAEIQNIPVITKKEYDAVKKNLKEGMSIRAVTFDDGVLSVTITAPAARNIPEYVANIKKEAIFENVSYSGYDRESYESPIMNEIQTETPETELKKQYEFTIICIMKGGNTDEAD